MKTGNSFIIPGRLPSLNEVNGANRTGWAVGAKMKKEAQKLVELAIMEARFQGTVHPAPDKCSVLITYRQTDHRRDVDNIQTAAKFILDAMQNTGVLITDGQKHVKQVFQIVEDADQEEIKVEIFDSDEIGIIKKT